MTDTITNLIASLNGLVDRLQANIGTKLDITGVAVAASKLETARAFYIGGDGVASGAFDGTGNVTLNLALKNSGALAGTYGSQDLTPSFTVNGKGIVTAITTVPTRRGVVPVASASALPAQGDVDVIYMVKSGGTTQLHRWNGAGYENMTAALTLAVAAERLTTPRLLSFIGDMSGDLTFDGSADVSTTLQLSNSGVMAGTYTRVTVDSKGRVTAGEAIRVADIPTLNQSTTGNAATANVLTTGRSITLAGDVAGSVAFDGSSDVVLSVVVAGNSHAHTISNITGLSSTLSLLATLVSPALTGIPTAPTAAAGTNTSQLSTCAFVKTEIGNLAPTKIGGGASGVWGISVTGNAGTATKLATARNLTISGDGTGITTYDGSGDSNTILTLSNTAVVPGTYGTVVSTVQATVDSKGRVTGISNVNIRESSLSLPGIVQLNDTTNNTSVTVAATANAVKKTYDLAAAAIPMSLKGAVNGVAELDSSGLVKSSQLPSYVDDVLEFSTLATFPVTGESGKIYIALDNDKIYRWSGSIYIEISPVVGNADSATKLATARNISLSSDMTGVVLFDGSANVNMVVTLPATGVAAGSYNASATTKTPFTVDAKGRLTGVGAEVLITPSFANITSKPTTISGYGITDDLKLGNVLGTVPAVASAGTALTAARSDHVHPIQTTISGNAATASKLATAVTINGTPFDGSASVTVADATKEPVIFTGPSTSFWLGNKTWGDINTNVLNSKLTGVVFTNSAALLDTDSVIGAFGKVQARMTLLASLASPDLTGTPTAPTAPLNTATAQIATTGFTVSQIANNAPSKSGFGASGSWNIDILGSAAKLTTGRTLAWTGDVSGSLLFDGNSNVSAGMTLADSGVVAGAYGTATSINVTTVDAKGRIVSFGPPVTITPSWNSVTGKPTTLGGFGITDSQLLSEKGAANGYAGLDNTGKVPASQLPSYVDDVLEFATLATFPATGETGKLYVAINNGNLYRWSGSVYVEISASPSTTDSVNEGASNLYFTAARAQAAVTSIVGNSATATKLATARTISVSGDAVASTSFDGSAAANLTLTLASTGVVAGVYNQSAVSNTPFTVDAKGRITFADVNVLITPAFSSITSKPTTIGGYGITDDLKLGNTAGVAATLGTVGVASTAARSDHSHPEQTTITGNAGTATLAAAATVLATARTISLSGDAVASGSFNGSANLALAVTLANSGVSAGTYGTSGSTVTPFTVDAKGRITGVSANVAITPAFANITGKPTTIGGYGITDDLKLGNTAGVENGTAIAGVSTTAARSDHTHPEQTTITGNAGTATLAAAATKLASPREIGVTGDATGSVSFDGTSSVNVPLVLANSGVTAGTYGKVTVDAKGRVTVGAALIAADIPTLNQSTTGNASTASSVPFSGITSKPTTLSGYGITDSQSISQKGVANGYAGLDATGKVPASQLPSYVDDVLEFATLSAFPGTGETGKLYVDIATGDLYRWSGSIYVEISASPGSTDSVTEGATNLYFTAARAQAAVTSIVGNAGTATKLATARTISLSGHATGSISFDGSAAVTIPVTLANSGVVAGTYGNATQIVPLTVDAKGRVTAVSAAITITPAFDDITSKPTTLAGYGIVDAAGLTSAVPVGGGVASAGTATTAARADHVHPTQTTVTGNAGSATVLQTARTINGVSFNGSANITVPPQGTTWLAASRINFLDPAGSAANGINTGSLLCSDAYADVSLVPANGLYAKGGVTTAGVFTGNGSGLTTLNAANLSSGILPDARLSGSYTGVSISGNAGTATKLATARTINGVAFDGTTNITISGSDTTKLPLTGGTLTGTLTASARIVANGSGSDYNSGGVELVGNGAANTVFPTIGFHQPSQYAASIQLRGGTDFRFYGNGASAFANITAAQYNGATLSLSGRATVGDVYSNGWLRTVGATGWYSETYAGGMYMTDTTYVRTYGGKQLFCNDGMQIDGAQPQIRLNDTGWGVRYLYHDQGMIGFLSNVGGWSFNVDNAGNTTATGNIAAYSDIRLKKDIEVIPDALEKISKLRGVTFTRIDSGERQTGVIAQEVQEVLPEAVMETVDGILAVAYGNIGGLYIEALKELLGMVNDLKIEVAELRSMV